VILPPPEARLQGRPLIGWLASNFTDAVKVGGLLAGVAYLCGYPILAAWVFLFRSHGEKRRDVAFRTVFGLALATWVLVTWNLLFIYSFGALGVLLGVGITVFVTRRQYKAARKVCPNCAETVKSGALVRYRQYRFEPPPGPLLSPRFRS
jgi:hypothetical protein